MRFIHLALLLNCGTILAQEVLTHASVSGRVSDPTGAVIEHAQVSARQTATNLTQTAVTDREGRFRFSYLKPGSYEREVRHPGFSEMRRVLTLSAGSAFDLPLTLTVESKETNITVQGEPV